MTRPQTLDDQADRDRAVRELGTSFLVEAAAGTGKTTLLVNRIMELLRTGTATLPAIAAITFTEKAAGELKVRLRREIEKALRSRAADDAPFRRALAELDAMTVATIHSFCADIIRERPVEAGVEPGFTVGDELAAGLLFDEAWQEWLAERMTPDNDVLRRAIEHGVTYADTARAPSHLAALARLLVNHRDLLPDIALAPQWTDPRFAQAAHGIRDLGNRLIEITEQHCTDKKDKAARQIGDIADWITPLDNTHFSGILRWLHACPAINTRLGNKSNWSRTYDLKEMKALAADLKQRCDETRSQAEHRLLCELAEWIKPFLDHYRAAKASRRMLDFTDLLILARNVLRDNLDVREYFKRAYSCLLVDEFQDTDPLQTEIIFFLAEQRGEQAESWDSVRVQPGKLFLVGDPKQSIYGFRRADLDLYGKVKNIMNSQGDLLSLRVNFRTVPEATNEINRIFQPLMTGPENGRFQPRHVPLVAFRQPGGSDTGVRFLSPPGHMDAAAMNADQWRRAESGCIAACIRQMIERGTNVFDKKDHAPRPARYGDVAVMFPTTTGLDGLEQALRAHDVPYQVSGGKHYYARIEFQDLLCVLKAIENPCDALSVVGALRSPFFGHSDADLLEHFAATAGFNYLNEPPTDCSVLKNAFNTLAELHARRNAAPVPIVLTKLFERTQALAVYAMKPHGEQRVANLLKVIDTARALAEVEVSSFGGLVRRLARLENAGQPESESPVAETDENFVQLLTFHKAKGLEFPIVFLAHLGNTHTASDQFVFDRSTGRLALKLGRSIATADADEAFKQKQVRLDHEARRLFYVAATRARDLLVIPAYWAKKPDDGLLKHLQQTRPPTETNTVQCDAAMHIPTHAFDLQKETHDKFIMRPNIATPLPPEAVAFQQHRHAWLSALHERAATLNAGRPITTATETVQKHPLEQLPPSPTDAALGKDIGTLVHNILERIDFRNPANLAALAAAHARTLGLPGEAIQTARELATRALALPVLARRAANAKDLHKEVPFTVHEGAAAIEGRIDLVFIEDGGAVIVDYKTDRVNAREAIIRAEHYRPQAETYVRAMQQVLDVPVKEMILLFIHPGVSVTLPPGNAPPKAL